MSDATTVITLGVHVVDVLVRPVEEIPAGQGGQLVEQIRITPAGPAGGTAVTLAKLGARARSAGAIGRDELGDVMLELLGRFGVDASLLVRRDDVQTSASVLPIRHDGSRPAFHVVGANATYSAAHAPWAAIEQAAAILDWIAPAFAHLDYLLPNEDQVLALTGERELAAGLPARPVARPQLPRRGHARMRRRCARSAGPGLRSQ